MVPEDQVDVEMSEKMVKNGKTKKNKKVKENGKGKKVQMKNQIETEDDIDMEDDVEMENEAEIKTESEVENETEIENETETKIEIEKDSDAEEDQENVNKPTKRIRKSVLDNFTQITKAQEGDRKKGGVSLMRHLLEQQNDENGQDELKYTLDRIVRGLGSPKMTARAGFFATFVAILSSTSSVSIEQIFELVKKHLQTGKSNAKSENADISAGQILVYGAIIRSKMFVNATRDEQAKILTNLIVAGKKRNYLALAAYAFIIGLFDDIDSKQFQQIVLPVLMPEISKPFSEQSLDTIYVLLNAQRKFPEIISSKWLKKNVGKGKIFCGETVEPLCELLLDIPVMTLKHPVCDLIAKEVASSEHLPAFVSHLDQLISKPVYNKHIIAVSLLKIILENLEDFSQIPDLLQNNFLQHTLTYFKTTPKNLKDELQQKVHQFFDTIVTVLRRIDVVSKTKLAVLKKLLFYPGVFIFEKITRSKIVQQITASLDTEGVKKLAGIYAEVVLAEKEKFRDESSTETWLNMDRLYAAQMQTKLLGHPAVQNEMDWKVEQLKFFIDVSILRDDRYRSVGYELAASLRTTFFRALDQKLPKLEDLRKLLWELIAHLDSSLGVTDGPSSSEGLFLTVETFQRRLRTPFTEEAYLTFKKTVEVVKKLDAKIKSRPKKKLNLVFHTLFLHLGLQMFGDVKMAEESIKELFSCYAQVKHKKKGDSTLEESRIELEDENSEDLLWIEVVIDLFLNLLSHNSHLLRSLIRCVFPHLCQHMNATAVHQILSVLDPKNESNPLSKRGESDDDDSENDSEDDENADNENGKGVINEDDGDNEDGSDKEDEKESDEDSESDDDMNDDDDEFEGNVTMNDKLRQAVQQALGANGYQTDEESIDIDDLSDTEAEKLNSALAQAFKQFKPNMGRRSKQNRDEATLTHFRVRVLDLIEIYLDSNPSILLSLEIMLPLLQTLEFTVREKHQQPLQDRVKSCLKKLSNLKKFSSVEDIDETVIGDLLRSILDKGTKNQGIVQEMDEAISSCCIFVLRCSQFLSASEEFPKKSKKKLKEVLVDVFGESLDAFFMRRDSLVPYVLLKEILQMNWSGNFKLAPKICQLVFDTNVRIFKRCQALILLKVFFTNNRLLVTVGENEKDKKRLTNTIESFSRATVEIMEKICKENVGERVQNGDEVGEGLDSEERISGGSLPSSGKVEFSEKFISNLFQVLAVMKRNTLKLSGECDWVKIGELARLHRSQTKLSKDGVSSFKQLCKSLGISNVVTMQLKNTPSTEKLEDSKTSVKEDKKNKGANKKEKRKARNKDKLKLKKEARFARMKIGSEGLSGGFSFANARLGDLKESEDGDEKAMSGEEAEKVEEGIAVGEEIETAKPSKKQQKKKRKMNQKSDVDTSLAEDEVQVKRKKKKSV